MKPLDPILISSATRRSGTTLMQRLLCSASNALVYGESCAQELQFALHFYQSKQMVLASGKAQRDELTRRVLNGEVNEWITDLMPPVDAYLQALHRSCFGLVDYFRQFALAENRPVWGLKMAEWPAAQLVQVQGFFPETKLIYIHRNLAACVRSALGISLMQNETEVEQFCQTWQYNFQVVTQHFPKSHLLLIDYGDLIGDPERIILQLEEFTGAKDIQASVLQKKVNTYQFDSRLEAGSEAYLQPVALSPAYQQIVEKYAGGV